LRRRDRTGPGRHAGLSEEPTANDADGTRTLATRFRLPALLPLFAPERHLSWRGSKSRADDSHACYILRTSWMQRMRPRSGSTVLSPVAGGTRYLGRRDCSPAAGQVGRRRKVKPDALWRLSEIWFDPQRLPSAARVVCVRQADHQAIDHAHGWVRRRRRRRHRLAGRPRLPFMSRRRGGLQGHRVRVRLGRSWPNRRAPIAATLDPAIASASPRHPVAGLTGSGFDRRTRSQSIRPG